jgi:hypothetical protein
MGRPDGARAKGSQALRRYQRSPPFGGAAIYRCSSGIEPSGARWGPGLVRPGLVGPDDNDDYDDNKITPQALDEPKNPAYDNNNSSNAAGPSRTTTTPRAME